MTGWCHLFAILTARDALKVVTKGIESVETGPSSRDVCSPSLALSQAQMEKEDCHCLHP